MKTTSIEILIKRCLKNDRVAQQQLYHLHADRLMWTARRYGNDISEAKDILQNSFIRIFHGLDRFDLRKGNFEAWSKTITIREAISFLRKKKNWLIYDEPDAASFNISGSINESVYKLNDQDTLSVINNLAERHKAILLMHFHDELSYKEMAEILGLKEVSVRSQVSRSRNKFVELWNQIHSV